MDMRETVVAIREMAHKAIIDDSVFLEDAMQAILGLADFALNDTGNADDEAWRRIHDLDQNNAFKNHQPESKEWK